MGSYVALLRGINVGGRNSLPMKDLVDVFGSLGYSDVRTYIQSGNVVFKCPKRIGPRAAETIGRRIQEARGFAPHVMILDETGFRRALDGNPFPVSDGKALHVFFLDAKPRRPDLERLAGLKAATEEFSLDDRVFYLHAPEGIARSKLAAGAEAALGVPVTARNWNTVSRLASMLEGP
jgi:uncharacterized protein (DUF1697 family)